MYLENLYEIIALRISVKSYFSLLIYYTNDQLAFTSGSRRSNYEYYSAGLCAGSSSLINLACGAGLCLRGQCASL